VDEDCGTEEPRRRREPEDEVVRRFVRGLAEAYAFIESGDYGRAARAAATGTRCAGRIAKVEISNAVAAAAAVVLVDYLVKGHDSLRSKALVEAYEEARALVAGVSGEMKRVLPTIRSKRPDDCRSTPGFLHLLARWTEVADEAEPIRTIHKSKGGEFGTVLVWIDTSALRTLLADSGDDDERRIFYVAMSRAIDRLFIGTPGPLSAVDRQQLSALAIEFEDGVPPIGPSQQLSLL